MTHAIEHVEHRPQHTAHVARCRDCGNAAQTQTFDGRRFRENCFFCALDRAKRRPPTWQLEGDEFVIGHAARCNVVFEHRNAAGEPIGSREMWRRTTFRRSLPGRRVVLSANHAVCRCEALGRDHPNVLDPSSIIASTDTDTLVLTEDIAGLFFVARIARTGCLRFEDGDVLNVHSAVANNHIAGMSLHAHGGSKEPTPGAPNLTVWCDVNLVELSMLTNPPHARAGSPGTWIQHGDQRAMERLHAELRSTARIWGAA